MDSLGNHKIDHELQNMARDVMAICGERDFEQILVDLQKTRSVEITLNRIFDGNFLEGTQLNLCSFKEKEGPFSLSMINHRITSIDLSSKENLTKEKEEKGNDDESESKDYEDSTLSQTSSIYSKARSCFNSTISPLNWATKDDFEDLEETVDLTNENVQSSKDEHLKMDSETYPKKNAKKKQKSELSNSEKQSAFRAKELEKLERQRQKEEQKAEKQKQKQFQQVNKLKYDKQEMTKELIIDIENNLMEEPLGSLLRDILESKLIIINVFQHQQQQNFRDDNDVPDVYKIIKWRRKVKAEWNEELDAFVPIPEIIKEEKYILVYFEIQEFIKLIEEDILHKKINNLQKIFDGKQLVVLIEGFDGYCRKIMTRRNRVFTNAVRTAIEEDNDDDEDNNNNSNVDNVENGSKPKKKEKYTKSKSKSKSIRNQGPDIDKIEDELIFLQLIDKCLIVHTKDIEETAEMIGILSSDIATIPYKHNNGNFNFWVENQVRAGKDCCDTWLRMLQEIQQVTQPVAKGILNIYPTVKSLYEAYERCSDQEEAENLLNDVEIASTGLGRRSRFVNKAVSKRIYEIFMGKDADVIIS
ncbi:hypothetical protein Glove_634g22 [Diversispora epigaea]|uniref:ERCC4 domain-containing protein n=1 Tax=Diversispora epigaea TaxID=1348612 RepID=A0A397G7X3_9GLOM|nr:hypothetical protein Glove_634g22 [Diversispora epigaea]